MEKLRAFVDEIAGKEWADGYKAGKEDGTNNERLRTTPSQLAPAPDYHQRFREMTKHWFYGTDIQNLILAFIDEVVAEHEEIIEALQPAYTNGRNDERAALIQLIEDEITKHSASGSVVLRALLTHLRGTTSASNSETVAMTSQELFGGYERLYKSLAGIQEETECCDGCKGLELIEAHTLCPCHKPRTEEPKAITGGVIGNGIPKWPRPLITSEETEKEGASFSGRGEVERTNELLRSMASIVARRGKDVNWDAFGAKLDAELKRQHAIMFPRPKENPTPPHFAGWKDTSTTPQSREQGGEKIN